MLGREVEFLLHKQPLELPLETELTFFVLAPPEPNIKRRFKFCRA